MKAPDGAVRLTFIRIGETAEPNAFQVEGNTEADQQTPMFGRGRIDHLGLQVASLDAFDHIRDRLIARDASDYFVTDFGPVLSVFVRDPDGLEGEVCVQNPEAVPGVRRFVFSAADRLCCRLPAGSQLPRVGPARRGSRAASADGASRPLRT